MVDELIVLGAGVFGAGGERLAEHVAGLAGGDLGFAIEGQRGLLGEAGALPLVIERDGAEPLVVVELAGNGGLVAGAAELGRFEQGAHDGLGVAVEVSEDFGVGDGAGDGLIVFVDQDGGRAHDVAAGADGGDLLDGVAGGAGDAFVLKGALFGHALGEIAGEQGDGVVAALAMAGVLNAFFVDEGVDVFEVPEGAEAVGVGGLTPLSVGLLVAVAAVGRGGEGFGAEELAVIAGGVGGQEGRGFAEGVVVAGGDRVMEGGGGAGDGYLERVAGLRGEIGLRRVGGGRSGGGSWSGGGFGVLRRSGVTGGADRPCAGEREGKQRGCQHEGAQTEGGHRPVISGETGRCNPSTHGAAAIQPTR